MKWIIYSVEIKKATPAGSVSGTSPINTITAADVQGNEFNIGDNDVEYKLYRNGTEVSNPDNSVLLEGIYFYIYNTTGGTNYTNSASLDTFELTVVTLELGNARVSLSGANNHIKILGNSRWRISG